MQSRMAPWWHRGGLAGLVAPAVGLEENRDQKHMQSLVIGELILERARYFYCDCDCDC